MIGHDQLVVVVAPGHPWARRRRPVDPVELAETQLVQRERGSGTRETLTQALLQRIPVGTVMANPALVLSSTAAVRAAIMTGTAPGALSALAVADDLALRRLVAVPLADLDLSRKLRAVWRSGPQPPAGPARTLVAVAGWGLTLTPSPRRSH